MGKFVAIEIGSCITKIVYGVEKKDDIVIKDYRLLKNSDKIFNPDGDLNINEIQPLLKNVFKDMKIRRADCYLTVGGQNGIVRLRELPMVKLKEMNEMVRFEAEQFLPYNIDGFYVDYRINQIKANIESDDESENNDSGQELAEVMIVATPKENVDEQVTLVDKLRLNIKRVDYYTDAIYCYFRKYILNESKNTLVVDLGSKGMKLTMFNGMTYFAGISSEIGLEDLFERYSEQNSVSIEESVRILLPEVDRSESNFKAFVSNNEKSKLELLREKMQFKSLEERHQNQMEFEVEPSLERLYEPLAYEVTKMMEFFKTRQFGMTVNEIYLIGGGANSKQLDTYLKYYHNTPVVKVSYQHNDQQISDYDYQLMVPVIGSLLKGGCL